jgi:hypothetical protein
MKLGTHMPDGERRKPIDVEICRTKVKVTTSKNRTKIRYFFASSTHHQAYVYQVSFRYYILFLRYCAETKKISNVCSIFRSCDLDLCPTIRNLLYVNWSYRSNLIKIRCLLCLL